MDNELDETISREGISVHGYIRQNFEQKCLIQEIITIIIKFFKNKGGFLYVCGSGTYGSLGIKDLHGWNKCCKEPTHVPIVRRIVDIAAMNEHTMAVDNEGSIWAFGYGSDGQLGTGNTEDIGIPQQIRLSQRAIAVSVGFYHSLILVAEGSILSCGRNSDGQLGHGDTDSQLVPKLIECLQKHRITQISAGGYHSGALSETGDLFMWGYNYNRQCGVGDTGDNIKTPAMIKLNEKVSVIECGYYHSLLITMSNLLYSFGKNDAGQSGYGSTQTKYVPTLIDRLKDIKIIKASAGYEHSMCIDDEFHVWAFGNNRRGQCGQPEQTIKQATPKTIAYFTTNEIKAKDVAAACTTSCVISQNNECFVFGKNTNYQIGLKEEKDYFVPTKLPLSVQNVSMATEYSTFISDYKEE